MASPKPTGHTPPPDKKKEDKPSGSGNGDAKKSSGHTPPRNRASRSPSPRSRGSRNRKTEKPHERVVERVVRDSSSAGSWPQLTKTNYNEWSLRMRLKL
jgi:rRNA maturation endonuclease Nob1